MKILSTLNTFQARKRTYIPHYWSDKVFFGTVVNRAYIFFLMESHLKIRQHRPNLMETDQIYTFACTFSWAMHEI